MGYRDENNDIVGFDIDLAAEVCKRLGVELDKQPISWDAKEQELNSGKIDCIWNGMSVSADRAAAMNLSDPYMNNRMVLVVLGDSTYNTLADLAGQSVGVQTGSTAQSILEEDASAADFYKSLKETVGYKDNVTAFMDLEAKGVAAVFLDEVVANHFITEQKKNYRVLDEGIAEEQYAIGFRKNDQTLRDKVQQTLSEMKADGTMAEISAKWFGKDVTIVK
jgi:polar amino acid transport system substrate-binding protein